MHCLHVCRLLDLFLVLLSMRALHKMAGVRAFSIRYSRQPSPVVIQRCQTSIERLYKPSNSRRWMSSGPGDGSGNDQEKVIGSQTYISVETTDSLNEDEHLQYQENVFDSISDWFADRDKEVTPELEPIYQAMAEDLLRQVLPAGMTREESDNDDSTQTIHILDVACGTGVLWEFMVEAANEARIQLVITGVDLSSSMVEHASERAQALLESSGLDSPAHSIQIVQSDIAAFCTTADPRAYDGVIVNACFGNFWDPRKILEKLPGPVICISHPLGASFVQHLHEQNPKMVRYLLPEHPLDMVRDWTFGLPLLPTYHQHTPYYLMTLQRCRATALPRVHRYRGVVDSGYGRGGKQLGVPTANLPASLFQNALQDVSPGVYVGWAALEREGLKDEKPFKAVVNVGYSPTFEGQENPEKIIEAHLILKRSQQELIGDFYGEVMRLQLVGFLRDEQKFDSFPQLVSQIQADVQEARDVLEYSPFVDHRKDPFLKWQQTSCHWIGTSGGDTTASWEFSDHSNELWKLMK